MDKGLIHIYTGNGKGKTTAAIGIAVRARSSGLKTLFVQFFKEKDLSSEITLLNEAGISTIVFDRVKSPFFNPDINRDTLRTEVNKSLAHLKDILAREDLDLVVLDEFICLIAEGVLPEEEAVSFLKEKPEAIEMVLTGKGATEKVMALADYVTFMQNIKHPYAQNRPARKGIEF